MAEPGVTRPTRRDVMGSGVRWLVVIAAMLVAYTWLPLGSGAVGLTVAVTTVVGLAVFGTVFVYQVRRIRRSSQPMLAAVDALVLVYATFLIQFAILYVSLSVSDPSSFDEPLNRVAGLYLSITVLSTVGFGDISPVSDLARIIVSVQMLADIVLIGTAFRVLSSTARRVATPTGGDGDVAD